MAILFKTLIFSLVVCTWICTSECRPRTETSPNSNHGNEIQQEMKRLETDSVVRNVLEEFEKETQVKSSIVPSTTPSITTSSASSVQLSQFLNALRFRRSQINPCVKRRYTLNGLVRAECYKSAPFGCYDSIKGTGTTRCRSLSEVINNEAIITDCACA